MSVPRSVLPHQMVASIPCPACGGKGWDCERCDYVGYVGVCCDGYLHQLKWEAPNEALVEDKFDPLRHEVRS